MTLFPPPEPPIASPAASSPSSTGASPLPVAPSPLTRWWLRRVNRRGRPDEKADITAQRQWLVYGGIGVVVAVLIGISAIDYWFGPAPMVTWLFALIAGGAVACLRMRPATALALAWAAGLVQVFMGIPLTPAELPVLAVLFFAARYGRLGVAIASGLTGPGAVVVLSLFGFMNGYRRDWAIRTFGGWAGPSLGVAVFALLALPWLAGLAVRFVDRAQSARTAQQTAERESLAAQEASRTARDEAVVAQQLAAAADERAEQAEQLAAQAAEIAHLREEQVRLTRDVHDVVGHSLTVILAQAESAQFLEDRDVAGLKATMRTVATAARASLQDVRDVLTPGAPRRTPARLEAILAGVADMNGRSTEITQVGSPRPLPPELDEVACRVLQEMLTNALRHGAASGPLCVELAWPDDRFADSLRIEVVNDLPQPIPNAHDEPSADSPAAAPGNTGAPARSGRGIDGMRRRLASVGGRLDVRRREDAADAADSGSTSGGTFTTAAVIPVRDVGARNAETAAPPAVIGAGAAHGLVGGVPEPDTDFDDGDGGDDFDGGGDDRHSGAPTPEAANGQSPA